jgi:DNA-binding response OmpR family regulator
MQLTGATVLGDVAIDFDRMELYCGDHLIPATSLEFRLLKFFIDNPKRVFTREELIEAVWAKRKRATLRTVDNFIRQLRLKFEKDPTSPIFFQTIRGSGYKFVPPASRPYSIGRSMES